MGRQTARVLPLGQRESFSYNAAGERSTSQQSTWDCGEE
jgi:hypothetical protein